MSDKKNSGPNEVLMAKLAAKSAQHGEQGVVKGKALPEDFQNPPPGSPKHLCIDLKGRYAPHWSQVQIIKGDQTGGRQFFNISGRKFWLRVGVWADCPPDLVNALEDLVVQEVEMDIEGANPLIQENVATVVNTIPRFNYRVLPSA